MTKSRREQYDEAKRLLEEINYELKTQPLTEAQRNELQLHAASLAGVLLHPWFPMSWTRRLIMAGIFLLGIQQALWTRSYEPLLWWLLLPFFSPRIMGECSLLPGRVSRYFRT
jgi:hypothetical protein